MALDGPWGLPELVPAGAGRGVIRLPELHNIAVTEAVLGVIDHPHFQRLRRVRQLGPTHLVYPGATHTRFEHSLGVYGTVVRYLQSLLQQGQIRSSLDEVDVRTVLMAGLLHDIGHYPFAHTLEALHHQGADTPRHEEVGCQIIAGSASGLPHDGPPIAELLLSTMKVDPERVMALMTRPRTQLSSATDRFLQSIISSALDADKMDYLWRDSVHLGVPYGRNYDRDRLLNSLTVNGEGDGLAVTSKGIVSAQIFLFCRYTMYSEVYWHHTVRSLSAMLEQAWSDLVVHGQLEPGDLLSRLLTVGDDELLRGLAAEAAPGTVAARTLRCITEGRRRPYRRLMTWSRAYQDDASREIYTRLHSLSSSECAALVRTLRECLGTRARPLREGDVILDIPPRDKDELPEVTVYHPHGRGGGSYTSLAASSRIVSGMGEDFLAAVKKIRVFVHPEHGDRLARDRGRWTGAVHEVLSAL
jgi:HD superfamily phosphohydrolase